jgi:hypothetical protein
LVAERRIADGPGKTHRGKMDISLRIKPKEGEHLNMKLSRKALLLAAIVASASGWTRGAYAHATYNISGYGSGLAGSTNGVDGLPAATPLGTWTNGGVADYTGTLPVNWYAGMHNATTSRIIQTGVAPTPASGSLLQQTNNYNTANDPDYATDNVLAVGGKSWSDPANGNQGWGHGLDYGLIHFTPLPTILAGGPVLMKITLADDPSDGASVQLAFAIYKGWDTGTGDRHQTFVTSPSPAATNPLSTTTLELVDYVVATTAGETLTRTYSLNTLNTEEFTVFVGALGGVAGQYQLTITPQLDSDNDGIPNVTDNCPNAANADQADGDGDGDGNVCDNCVSLANADQADSDSDGIGNVCDNCASVSNADQADGDSDTIGNVCDNCPLSANSDQADGDTDTYGDVCDNCPVDANAAQTDTDSDSIGDECDPFPLDADVEAALLQCRSDLTDTDALLVTASSSLATCSSSLATASAALTAATADADGDGRRDIDDTCPSTPASTAVDQQGCSLAQFCASFPTSTRPERTSCTRADWKNDEAYMKISERDCKYFRPTRSAPYTCIVKQ